MEAVLTAPAQHRLVVPDIAAMPLVVADALADLAETGIQPALERVAEALGVSLTLVIEDARWQAGTGPVGPAAYHVAEARLIGLPQLAAPDTQPDAGLKRALRPFLRALLASVRVEADTRHRIAGRDRLLRRLFDLSPVGVVLIVLETGRIVDVNAAFMGFGSWPRDALIGAQIHSILSPDNQDHIARATSALQAEAAFGPYNLRFVCPDGSDFPALVQGRILVSDEGTEIVWLMVEDVSEQQARLAESQASRDDALRARAELQTALRALSHGFVLFDEHDRVVLVNDQMDGVYPELAPLMVPGRHYDDILTEAVVRGIFPEADGRTDAFIAEILAARQAPFYERVTPLRDGRFVRVLERAIPTGGRVGMRIDVTEQHVNERRLREVIEGSQVGTWECDFLTGTNTVNDRWLDMLGWTRAVLEPIMLSRWLALVHPDDRAVVDATISAIRSNKSDLSDYSFRMRHREGHWVWIQSRGRVSLRGVDGSPVRVTGVHIDISALKAAELRVEQIIEGAEVGTYHHNIAKGECHVNEQWAGMLGYTRAELGMVTDAMWEDLMHPEDFARLEEKMAQRFARGQWQFLDEFRLRHRAGHWVWVASRGRVTACDTSGRPSTTSGIHLDISARKRLEVDLEAERDLLATLIETSVSGVMAVDADARIVFLSREVQRILERSSDALLNQICDPAALGFMDDDGRPLAFADLPFLQVLATGQVRRGMRLRVQMPDGRVKVLSVNAAELPYQVKAARVVCAITDITLAARAEDDLRAATDRAETANRAKSQFLANMSHELRTPLNGVLGMAELLSEQGLTATQREMIDTIRESGAHLLSIVNDLLDLAKIESGKLGLELAPLRLGDLGVRVEVMHRLAAQAKGVSLSVAMGPGVERPRVADATRVMQILHNLVGNAVKFTETGRVDVTISADPDAGPDATSAGVMLRITDTGIGMTEAQAALVFDEFTQGDGSITRRFGGTGLGLPIVRRLVQLMGGDVTLHSVPALGTTVTVRLPLPICEAGDDLSGPVARPSSLRGLRALLAEDNATNRMILRAMLTRLGLTVTLALDGEEAVALWEPGRFDVVLLDISMPHKDGVSALRDMMVKAGGEALPPVLAVTAHAMPLHMADYRAAGFAEVVAKPVSIDALAAAICRVQAARSSAA
jgi:PAS domain S-box-containing protein